MGNMLPGRVFAYNIWFSGTDYWHLAGDGCTSMPILFSSSGTVPILSVYK